MSPPSLPEPPALPDSTLLQLLPRFEAYIHTEAQQLGIAGLAVAIVHGNGVVDTILHGNAHQQKGIPIHAHSVFRTASLSKGFAPVLVGRLVEEGVLDWDDRVKDYLPWLELSDSTATEELRIRHLLSHTTGLPRHTYSNLLNMEVPLADILPMLKEVEVAHPVGTYYNYQNVVYSLIEPVLEKATGKTYADLLQTYLFDPTGMCHTSLGFEALINDPNVVYPHLNTATAPMARKPEDTFYSVAAAAGINASITDMATWTKLLLGQYPKLIQATTLDSIFTPQIWMSTRENALRGWRPLDKAHYAMGWRVLQVEGHEVVCHSGYVDKYRTELAFDREHQLGMVFLSNTPNGFASRALRWLLVEYWKQKSVS